MPDSCRIGVTRWDDVPGEAVDRYWSRITDAGATIVDLDESTHDSVAALAADLDGLMLTGGIDVDPSAYGQPRHPKVKETDPDRDAMETTFVRAALQRDIPVLAICRGHQLLNVAMGGSLLQHIDSGEHRADYRTEGYPSRWHDIRLLPDSHVARAYETLEMRINSRHHQAVRAAGLAPGLRAVGFADEHGDDLIEAVESTDHSWVVGVQWHPERLEEQERDFHPLQRRLFEAFVSRARNRNR